MSYQMEVAVHEPQLVSSGVEASFVAYATMRMVLLRTRQVERSNVSSRF
jgi:hypothetical protein